MRRRTSRSWRIPRPGNIMYGCAKVTRPQSLYDQGYQSKSARTYATARKEADKLATKYDSVVLLKIPTGHGATGIFGTEGMVFYK